MQPIPPPASNTPELPVAPDDRWPPELWFEVRTVDSHADLSVALHDVVADAMPVITLVGGANGAGAATGADRAMYEEILLSAARFGAAVLFGGTDSGCLAELGRAKRRLLAEGRLRRDDAPLIGIVAEGTVAAPGTRYDPNEKAPLQPDQDRLIVVPGKHFGDESWALAEAGRILSQGQGSATVLVNGGGITVQDATHRLQAMTVNGRPDPEAILLAYRGSGRAADDIIAAKENGGGHPDPRINAIAAHSGTRAFDSAADLRRQLSAHFTAAGQSAGEPGGRRALRRAPQVTVPPLSVAVPATVVDLTPKRAYEKGRTAVEGIDPRPLREARTDPELHRTWRRAAKASRLAALNKLYRDDSRYRQDDRAGDIRRSTAAYLAGVREAFWRRHDTLRDGQLSMPNRLALLAATGFRACTWVQPLRPGDAEPVLDGGDWSRAVLPARRTGVDSGNPRPDPSPAPSPQRSACPGRKV